MIDLNNFRDMAMDVLRYAIKRGIYQDWIGSDDNKAEQDVVSALVALGYLQCTGYSPIERSVHGHPRSKYRFTIPSQAGWRWYMEQRSNRQITPMMKLGDRTLSEDGTSVTVVTNWRFAGVGDLKHRIYELTYLDGPKAGQRIYLSDTQVEPTS